MSDLIEWRARKSVVLAKVLGFCLCVWSCVGVAQGVFDHPVQAGSAEAESLEVIADELRQNLPVSGAIKQQKHLAILREPMVSKGAFTLAADGDLQWRITEPFAVAYSMAAGELTREMDGKSETITASAEPALYGFFQLFGRLFDLSLQDLNSYFSVYLLTAAEAGEHWVIGLTPQDSRLQKVLSHIVVQGEDGMIDQVTLTEPGEDYTVLYFSYAAADETE
jgi:hypothetical protein